MNQLINSEEATQAFTFLGFIYLVLGALYCFLGYRIFRTLIFLAGAITGIALFLLVVTAAGGLNNGDADITSFLLGCLMAGLLGGGLFTWLYFVGIFLLGAILGAGLGLLMTGGTGGDALIVILAILGGAAAIAFQKFIIIIATAFNGAQAIVDGFILLGAAMSHRSAESVLSQDHSSAGQTFLVLLLTAVGIFVQYKFFGIEPVKKAVASGASPKPVATICGEIAAADRIEGQPTHS